MSQQLDRHHVNKQDQSLRGNGLTRAGACFDPSHEQGLSIGDWVLVGTVCLSWVTAFATFAMLARF